MGLNPRDVAKAGRKVYERHRAHLEHRHRGKFVLIDVRTEKLYLAESAEKAYERVAAEGQPGPFHLLRIGARAAFRSRRLVHGVDTRGIR